MSTIIKIPQVGNISVGDTVISGVSNSVLFLNSSKQISSTSLFTYDGTTVGAGKFASGWDGFSPGFFLRYSGSEGPQSGVAIQVNVLDAGTGFELVRLNQGHDQVDFIAGYRQDVLMFRIGYTGDAMFSGMIDLSAIPNGEDIFRVNTSSGTPISPLIVAGWIQMSLDGGAFSAFVPYYV